MWQDIDQPFKQTNFNKQEKALKMGEFYLSDFEDLLCEVNVQAGILALERELREEQYINSGRKLIKTLLSHFDNFKQEELEILVPEIVKIKYYLNELHNKFEDLALNPQEKILQEIIGVNNNLFSINKEFKERFVRLIEEARDEMGDPNFNISVTDSKGEKSVIAPIRK